MLQGPPDANGTGGQTKDLGWGIVPCSNAPAPIDVVPSHVGRNKHPSARHCSLNTLRQ